MQDERAMREALKLARNGLGNTSPNPMVGALVIAAGDTIAGRGFHAHAGADHAEVVALREAGERARGATLYVTLEPCAHQGQTPPCVDAIIAAHPARVVIALEDPDERVRGKGVAALRAAGITVDVGVLQAQAAHANRMYLHQRGSGLPFVTLKMAQSLDGKRAQRLVRTLRFEHDAVMVGAGTVIVDDPQLTVRPYKPRRVPYTRIVVDAHGRLPLRAKILKDQLRARTIVVTTDQMPPDLKEQLQSRNISVLECSRDRNGLVDLHDALRRLAALQLVSILCEGGPTLAASLLGDRLASELLWLVAPVILGAGAISVVGASETPVDLEADGVRRLGDDLALSAHLKRA